MNSPYLTTAKASVSYGMDVSRGGMGSGFAPPVPATTQQMNVNSNQTQLPLDFYYGLTRSEVGSSGLRQFSGWVREEFLPQLVGRQAARSYREMRDNSPVVGSLLFAINATMRRVSWRVEPADDSPEAAERADFFDGCKDDMSHTWSDFVDEQLTMLPYGFAPHELCYKRCLGQMPGLGPDKKPLPPSHYDDGLVRWRKLPLRGQETVLKWFFGDNGEILGMTQQPWTGPIANIPIEKMLLFRPSAHKNNPEGRSILRNAAISWYFVKRLQEQEAIMFERMGGIPVMKIPKAIMDGAAAGIPAAQAALNAWKRIATNVRIDEQMGLVIPSDTYEVASGTGAAQYSFELVTPQQARAGVDSDKMITRHNLDIMASVLADFIQLGHESHGTQSLAVSKVDLFMQAMEGFVGSNADVMSRYAVPRLGDLNGFDRETLPQFAPDMPQRMDLDVLSNFILRLSQAGMPLFPNETLEEYLTDAAGMPDITEDESYEVLRDAALEAKTNPPPAPGTTGMNPDDPNAPPTARGNLEKIIIAAAARRFGKMNGPVGKARLRKRRQFIR